MANDILAAVGLYRSEASGFPDRKTADRHAKRSEAFVFRLLVMTYLPTVINFAASSRRRDLDG